MFGVRPTTIARWVREGKLTPLFTPGGHRRYNFIDIKKMVAASESTIKDPLTADAVHLYDQGWNAVANRRMSSSVITAKLLQE